MEAPLCIPRGYVSRKIREKIDIFESIRKDMYAKRLTGGIKMEEVGPLPIKTAEKENS